MDPFSVATYDYDLPSELIAFNPLADKKSARVLIYERQKDTIIHTTFRDILDYIPQDTAIVINDTKVVKARIYGEKSTGGKVELLLNAPLQENHFSVYIKGRVKPGSWLRFDHGLKACVIAMHDDGLRVVEFFLEEEKINAAQLFDVLELIGHIPLPPYIKREDTQDDCSDYQSVFAKHRGAVAAPTASLHFDDEMFEILQNRFETQKVTLHVGAGTFKPVTCEDIHDHKMHEEYFDISNQTCELIRSDKPILAIGTTVTRTIEYYARVGEKSGYCDLFLHPQNKPIRVNHLLTNFHLPKSTLLMLVASFVGIEKTMALYEEAVKEKYRFFSYGDAMLIL
ncbi:tRNA preQ1(34) S-adenosylmethionine ribosyltransferase-isomerase QueA [Sulfurospirillum sp. 1612]|uniref:tRNA preQ1(34) S-adenosylmethionine ribosyltransferase-isomerase QueA n=1 Tax=Sulfurospirillum sp. 1612 TaxID=3094835 RepID=UPI002F949564